MSQSGIINLTNSGTPILATLTGNSGGAVGADVSQNINIIGTGGVIVTGNPATNTLTISASSSYSVTIVNHAASPYTVLITDEFLSVDVTAGVVTLNFPNGPTTGSSWIIKDAKGLAGTNNITYTTPGGTVTFDGATSKVLNSNYESVQVLFDGTNYEIF
jgi:hypothetical protein